MRSMPAKRMLLLCIIHPMLITLLALSVVAFSGCGGSGETGYMGLPPISPPTANEICADEARDSVDVCYETDCQGCAGISCLYCYSWCQQNSGYTYLTCCSDSDCVQSVSGYVRNEDGTGVPDVIISTEGEASQITDQEGYYKFANFTGGRITPEKPGFCFDPQYRSYSLDYLFHTDENFTASQQCWSISGIVLSSSNTPLAGIGLDLTGTETTSTTTGSSGSYAFTELGAGAYTVTPSRFGATPASRSATIENSDLTDQDFVITGRTISGRIVLADGTAMPDITVTLSGEDSSTTTTDKYGFFTFAGLNSAGSYTITPSKHCEIYLYDPISITINLVDNDMHDQNFSLSLNDYNITGNITAYGAPLSGVSVTRTGKVTESTITDANGRYMFTDTQDSLSLTITPSELSHGFIPGSRSVVACGSLIDAQDFVGTKTWVKSYSSGGATYLTSDGNMFSIINDPYTQLAKLDSLGNIVWTRNVANPLGGGDLVETSDGGVIAIGNSGPNILVVKSDHNGNGLWKTGFRRDDMTMYAGGVVATSDGGAVATGYSLPLNGRDLWVARFSDAGDVLWLKSYDSGGLEVSPFIQKTNDGGYILTSGIWGHDEDLSNHGIAVMKLDENGAVLWMKTYYGGAWDGIRARYNSGWVASIHEVVGGGYIIASASQSFDASENGWILRLDAEGTVLWQKTYGGEGNDLLNYVTETEDGSFIATGLHDYVYDPTVPSRGNFWMLKLNGTGDVLWERTYFQGIGTKAEIMERTDGAYFAYSSPKLMKTNPDGTLDLCDAVRPIVSTVTNANAVSVEKPITVADLEVLIWSNTYWGESYSVPTTSLSCYVNTQ